MLKGIKHPNPKKRFLVDLSTMIKNWREDKNNCDIVLMADMNEYIGDKKDLYNFCQSNDLIDSIALMNPDLDNNPTYLRGSKRIGCIFISPALAEVAVKAGHHQFNQHFVSDHKSIYI